ncbi:hypothetical protein [Rhodothermus bifroesti]|uniref:Uncharacterized protein n=1 Tax=Rhodothermus marinus TaxID=29549 RepID=A0A7V2F7W5_RHOMR|nr:hypothetical protein [Rhodothermus bifroesti]GBD00344.1 hypothetical protein HRbin18_00051 [bacterium HR18]
MGRWLKEAWLDGLVTVVIVLAAIPALPWARWIVLVYTPFMLLLKLVALWAAPHLPRVRQHTPQALFHVLYGLNVLVLGVGRWWWMAFAWALIWGLSAAIAHRQRSA